MPYELLEQARRSARQFSIILGTIASISLLVGGIGIMNIMLATVTERTREIGIRRALGAKRRDIIQQFLIECVLFPAIGGLAGVLLGMGIPRLIVYFFPDQKTIITVQSVLLAFGISVLRRHPVRHLPRPPRSPDGSDRGSPARVGDRL